MEPTENTRKKRETSSVVLDGNLIKMLLRQRGETLSRARTGEYGGVTSSSWHNASAGKNVRPHIAKGIADYLGKPMDCLLLGNTGSRSEDRIWGELKEWEFVEPLSPRWETTTNDLCYLRCKVRDRFLSTDEKPVFGRARLYNLGLVSSADRKKMEERLVRHPQVSRDLARFSQFVTNLAAAPVDDGSFWWVVDEWFCARRWSDVLTQETVSFGTLVERMQRIAEGLKILGERRFLMRKLSPECLLLATDDEVRIADLDLVKLLDGGQTVSTKWIADPYLAPEVDSTD